MAKSPYVLLRPYCITEGNDQKVEGGGLGRQGTKRELLADESALLTINFLRTGGTKKLRVQQGEKSWILLEMWDVVFYGEEKRSSENRSIKGKGSPNGGENYDYGEHLLYQFTSEKNRK